MTDHPSHRRFVVLGNPRSRRVAGFQSALGRQGYLPAHVVAYEDYLAGRDDVASHLNDDCVLRIESPGEAWEVEKLLLKQGIEGLDAEGRLPLTAAEVDRLEFQRGAILRPRQWYLGFVSVLKRLREEIDFVAPLQWMAHPDDISLLFDKTRCQPLFRTAGLPVPNYWLEIESYDRLREKFRQSSHRRLFVKIANGFSAVGAVALEWRGHRVRALSPVELVGAGAATQLFLSKRIHRYTNERDVASLIDALAGESLLVEEWLPKARIDAMSFDLRVVTVAGRVCHVVGRAGHLPFTNLNLGCRRIEATRVRDELGHAWDMVQSTCQRVAALFPRSLYLGVDLLVRPDRRRLAVLEANAFGDLLPGLLHDGRETYETEILALAERQECVPC